LILLFIKALFVSICSPGKEGNLIPKCGAEYYAVLNEFEEI